ncbi:uncharacterized protein (DUF58 family) [Spinactinospora alkalitolerans]|uniref:Uncharacterized protein (DUF58 family) n=1 Tax=Spinactinospora alkalitolerans TaxID=687207 RepID=A0A852U3U8_9ACTN|nr:DUF58 domain-containing protein [Spinactinospora alkalitolerans]NYE48630.1 uncharacterized protein (DUF58 family) [Spinactinospora alkalitolerans]
MILLRSLTLRGRVFLCVGIATAVGALLVGERDLLRVGVFVVALPVISALTVARVPRNVTHTRALAPARVMAGGDSRVLIRLTNASPVLPTGTVLVADTLPYALGEPPRFNAGRLRPGQSRELTYRVRSHVRGRYPIGPVALHFRDPLGCVQLVRHVGASMALLVTPTIVALPGPVPRGDSADSGESRARSMSSSGEDDAVPREYRHGDDVRRVHWRSTARRGELMVRREEQPWREHSAVLLDLRESAHAGAGPDSSLEAAVSMAGSIAVHLLGRGQELRFLTNDTEITALRREDAVLDALAVARPSSSTGLHTGIAMLENAAATGRGLAIAVLGAVGEGEAEALAGLRGAREGRCVAVLCRGAAWPAPAARERARELLTGAGWRVLEPDTAQELPGAWRGLAARAG